MKQLHCFFLFVCLIQCQGILATIPKVVYPDPRFFLRASGSLDCTQYSTDFEILSSFSFVTHVNPLVPSSASTYATMRETDESVTFLNIASERSVPLTVFCLKSLNRLSVSGTSFHENPSDNAPIGGIPAEIEHLAPSLSSLSISDTTIDTLPEQIGKLSRLNMLELRNTGLVSLPDSIGNLSSLSSLSLQNNKLTSLPATLANLRNLRSVVLTNNPKLRSVQSFNGLPYLYSLNTGNCLVERLPRNLPSLYYLHMYNNNLTDLANIGSLGNSTAGSKYFYFNMNFIRYIPPQIGSARNLYWLDLANNNLATLPTSLFNVTTLRYLDIRKNLFYSNELRAIVAKFNATNPSLSLHW